MVFIRILHFRFIRSSFIQAIGEELIERRCKHDLLIYRSSSVPSRYRRDRCQGRTVAFPRSSRRRSCRSVAIGRYIRFVSENDDAATPCDEKWRVRVKSPEWNAWIGLARGACHGTGIDSKWWITERARTASSLDVFALRRLTPSPFPLCFERHSDAFYQCVLFPSLFLSLHIFVKVSPVCVVS